MTKINLDLHQLLTDAIGDDTVHIPATVDLSELLEFTDAVGGEHDLDLLLHDNRLIAHVWSVQDVQSVRPDLNDDQAWEVLLGVEKCLDCSFGITWEIIETAAIARFGDPQEHRLKRCREALAHYGGLELADFLADAMLWCQENDTDFETVLLAARHSFYRDSGDSQ
jgi:hypothetical protein